MIYFDDQSFTANQARDFSNAALEQGVSIVMNLRIPHTGRGMGVSAENKVIMGEVLDKLQTSHVWTVFAATTGQEADG